MTLLLSPTDCRAGARRTRLQMLKRIWDSVIPVRIRRSSRAGGADRAGEPDPSNPEQEGSRAHEEEEIFPAVEEHPDRPLNPMTPFIGPSHDDSDDGKQTIRIEIPTHTILKVIGTLLIIWLLMQVLTILLLLFLATLFCLALLPPVRRLQRQGMPRVAAAGTVYLVLLLIVIGFFGLIVPPLVEQGDSLIENAPDYAENFGEILDRYPSIREQIENLGDADETSQITPAGETIPTGETDETSNKRSQPLGEEVVTEAVETQTATIGAGRVLGIGASILGGVANTFFVIVLTFYLLIEGDRTWRYFARLMKPRLRYRFHRLGPELTNVVSGYLIGQAINSALFGAFTYVTLLFLGVPEPLLLAIIAAIMDGIPIVGVPVATIAAMALALTVGWQTSLIVLAAFIIYQQFENYVLLPRVFGNTLQVSALSILVGVLVGGQLLGVLGIILSLPVTASIPVIERVWREVVPDDVEKMEREDMTGPAPTTQPSEPET